MRGRQYPAGGRLEVEDIERVFRLGDDGLAGGSLFPKRPNAPVRASGLDAAHFNSLRRAVRLALSCLTFALVSTI